VPGPSTQQTTPPRLRKRPADEEGDTNPRKTRGVIVDYKQLDNPFSDSKDDEDSMIAIYLMINDKSYTAATNNGPISLKEAKQSPDWPEWKKAIQAELEQLQDMGTSEIVKKPLDAIPIANKWLFI
jgi:hypothetical protein